MAEGKKEINIIAAVCNGMGIGYQGRLPWPTIKGDRDFLLKCVTSVKDNNKKNALIYGRTTMVEDAQCSAFPDTITIVLSRNIKEKPDWTDYLCHSLEEALSLVNGKSLSDQVESVWIMGGTAVYKCSLKYCDYIYLTTIFEDFKCDTLFPEIDWSSFVKYRNPEVDESEQIENGIKFKFEVYKRK